MTTVSTQAIAPHLVPNLQYDPAKDFASISHVANVPLVLIINPQLPAKNLKEFVALLKANPGKYVILLPQARARRCIWLVNYSSRWPALTFSTFHTRVPRPR